MPKKLINDYIFYKIVCLDDSCELCYVGSTANWKLRKRKHTFNCTNEKSDKYNTKVYKTIRANGGWYNFKMIQIGTRPQLTFRQAEEIEEDYRAELKASLNGRRCYITKEQKREQNKEHCKKHLEANPEYYKEILTCKCGCQIMRANLARHKRSQLHIRLMELLQNKDNIKADTIDKVVCECGCQVVKKDDGLARHKKTQKHIKLMELLQND